MSTKCYAQVRGSSLRVTELGALGQYTEPLIRYAVSKSVVKVTINEVAEGTSNEVLRTEDEEARLHFVTSGNSIRYTVDIEFLRVDPGVLNIVSGAPVILNAAGDIVGFDGSTKVPAAAFALEVWTRLAGVKCEDGTPMNGYTLFPFLKGGTLSGFSFANDLVSFNLRTAQSRRVPRWGVGPYDMEGPHQRLVEVVSRNSSFQNLITPAAPPAEADGVQATTDIIDGGGAASTSSDIIDGEYVVTSPWIVEGGRAL